MKDDKQTIQVAVVDKAVLGGGVRFFVNEVMAQMLALVVEYLIEEDTGGFTIKNLKPVEVVAAL